jgi:hypothetical protein
MNELQKTKQKQREIGIKRWEEKRGTARSSVDLWLVCDGKSCRVTVYGKENNLPRTNEQIMAVIKKAVEDGAFD